MVINGFPTLEGYSKKDCGCGKPKGSKKSHKSKGTKKSKKSRW